MVIKARTTAPPRTADLVLGMVVIGSLWGLSEIVLNGAIRMAGLPLRAGILAGVGMLLMGISVGIFRNPSIFLGIAAVAVLCKQLCVPILHVSVMCKANTCLAVVLQSIGLFGAVTIMSRRRSLGTPHGRMVAGMSAALFASVAFYFMGMRLAPCSYLLSFARPTGAAAFVVNEGLVWGAFSSVLFPLGWRLGERFGESILGLRRHRPLLYYGASSGVVLCSWIAGGLAIAGGF